MIKNKVRKMKMMMMERDKSPSECIWGQNINLSSKASSMTWRTISDRSSVGLGLVF